ncbi:hypothetical protein K1X13_06360 [Nocardioides sp. WL0053]|uniref:WD40 repeat protein n=1 Tax=Nocardioides jiangsuensis TaxID=2866161 RepID=A0ABS7RHD0_9ACTN|nr:hypothetical protein [Nocardioides jiangsuensis]MBY9074436.1 hypothetical protein [Nocardioides jiangsuensis]
MGNLSGRRVVAGLAAAAMLTAAPLLAPLPSTVAVPTAAAQRPSPGVNGRIAFVAESTTRCSSCYDIFTVRPDGTGLRQLTRSAFVGDPAWSPGGRRLLFTRVRPGGSHRTDIWVMGSAGRNKKRLISHRASDYSPAWAPSGRRFVFTSGRGDMTQLYVYSFETRRVRRLLDPTKWRAAGSPAWSPDRRRIAFIGNRAGDPEVDWPDLFTVRPDGTGLRRLTETPDRFEDAPDWAPSGRRLVYARARGFDAGCTGPFIIRRDGTGAHRVPGACGYWSPTWSPDGRRIADTGIWIFAPDGTPNRLLVDSGSQPDWQTRPGT